MKNTVTFGTKSRRLFAIIPAVVIGISMTALSLTGCFSPCKGEGTIAINVGGSNSRAAGLDYPSDDPALLAQLEYRIKLDGPTGAQNHTLPPGTLTARFTAAPGLWNVTVEAYHEGDLYAAGTGSVEVKAGQSNSVIIQMKQFVWEYTVTFNSNGGTFIVSIVNVPHGNPINQPADPKKGYVFGGWYKEAALTNQWNFVTDTVTANMTLYAKWGALDGSLSLGGTGPGGGIIFYVDTAGFTMTDTGETCHYLEAAPSDSGTADKWSYDFTLISGITTFTATADPLAAAIGNGRKDTHLILAHQNGLGETGTAAQLCDAANFGGQTDWFLPSLGELNQLFLGSVISSSNYYWSSSQTNNLQAWYQRFNDGYQAIYSKNKFYSVRAVRAF